MFDMHVLIEINHCASDLSTTSKLLRSDTLENYTRFLNIGVQDGHADIKKSYWTSYMFGLFFGSAKIGEAEFPNKVVDRVRSDQCEI